MKTMRNLVIFRRFMILPPAVLEVFKSIDAIPIFLGDPEFYGFYTKLRSFHVFNNFLSSPHPWNSMGCLTTSTVSISKIVCNFHHFADMIRELMSLIS